MTHASQTLRGQILEDARTATEGDRNKTYGDPLLQLGLAQALKEVCNAWRRELAHPRPMSDGEREAIDTALTKISRIMMGPVFHRDNYVDGAAYLAIAGEIGLRLARLEEKAEEHD